MIKREYTKIPTAINISGTSLSFDIFIIANNKKTSIRKTNNIFLINKKVFWYDEQKKLGVLKKI